jgi:hypothetical protein
MPLSQAPPQSNRIKIKAIFKKPRSEVPEESEIDIDPITQETMFEPLIMFTPRGTYVFTLVLHIFILLGIIKFGVHYLLHLFHT